MHLPFCAFHLLLLPRQQFFIYHIYYKLKVPDNRVGIDKFLMIV